MSSRPKKVDCVNASRVCANWICISGGWEEEGWEVVREEDAAAN